MNHEYVVTKELTLNEVVQMNIAGELSLAASNRNTYIQNVLAGLITGFSLWLTAPINVAVATLASGLLFQVYSDLPSSRTLMQKGYNEMLRVEAAMSRNSFEKVRVNIGAFKYYGEGTSVDIIQAVQALQYYKNGQWISYT